jgi:adenylate cyclase
VIRVAVVVVGALIIVWIAVSNIGFNVVAPRLDRHRRERDGDRMFLDHYCRNGLLFRYRWINRKFPANPRCKFCFVPFGGVGRVTRVKPSAKNPNFCRGCLESAPMGGHETEVGVLFADLRGFTAWSADRPPATVAAALNRFYTSATKSLMAHDAIIDKFAGDEVMALFLSDMSTLGTRTCDEMMSAAEDLITAARIAFDELPIGIGLNYGSAWVGNVGSSAVKDFTALGDVVNVAARLQACAGPGEIVLSEDAYARLARPPDANSKEFVVKGKEDAIRARIATPL